MPDGGLQTVTLVVKGMSCGHCKMAVEKAARGVSGVTRAEVDLDKGLLQVTFDPVRGSLQEIQKAVTEAGYGVQESGAHPQG